MASVGLSASLLAIAIAILQRDRIHKESSDRFDWFHTYDYVVVGSGTAGSVVANRLAEDLKTTVLLLEAGLPQSVTTDIPTNYLSNLGSEFDWNYKLVRQPTAGLAFSDQLITENRGRVLGGSSTLNSMIYNRANPKDYDNWQTNYGAEGWAFQQILPYFLKSENNTDVKLVAKNPGYHSFDGPVEVSSWSEPAPIIALHQKALNRMGFETIDVNGGTQLGTALLQAFIRKDGMRSSAANSFLDPNPYPHNLHVLNDAFCTKILFSSNGFPVATGVRFVKSNSVFEVSADKEVIISAGKPSPLKSLQLSLWNNVRYYD